MSRPRLLAGAAAALAALVLGGCAINPEPVSTAGRPDVTAAPPKSYGEPAVEDVDAKKPGPKKPGPKKPGPKQARQAARAPQGWVTTTDAPTGVRLALPGAAARRTDTDAEGVVTRSYNHVDRSTGQAVSVTVSRLDHVVTTTDLDRYMDLAGEAVERLSGAKVDWLDATTATVEGRPTMSRTMVLRARGLTTVSAFRMVGRDRTLVVMACSAAGPDAGGARAKAGDLMDKASAGLRFP